jgi:hypothetical protein
MRTPGRNNEGEETPALPWTAVRTRRPAAGSIARGSPRHTTPYHEGRRGRAPGPAAGPRTCPDPSARTLGRAPRMAAWPHPEPPTRASRRSTGPATGPAGRTSRHGRGWPPTQTARVSVPAGGRPPTWTARLSVPTGSTGPNLAPRAEPSAGPTGPPWIAAPSVPLWPWTGYCRPGAAGSSAA